MYVFECVRACMRMLTFAAYHDLCRCMDQKVELWCHKQAQQRVFIQYGPSWEVPLPAKQFDTPFWCSIPAGRAHKFCSELGPKETLRSMVDNVTGFIEASSVQAAAAAHSVEILAGDSAPLYPALAPLLPLLQHIPCDLHITCNVMYTPDAILHAF